MESTIKTTFISIRRKSRINRIEMGLRNRLSSKKKEITSNVQTNKNLL